MTEERLCYLLEKFASATCTREQSASLDNWYRQLVATHELFVPERSLEAEELKSMMLTEFHLKI